MPRIRTVTWEYRCDNLDLDGLPDCIAALDINVGDHIETGRGTVIHDQADADAAARQDGWRVGRTTVCPAHAGGDA